MATARAFGRGLAPLKSKAVMGGTLPVSIQSARKLLEYVFQRND